MKTDLIPGPVIHAHMLNVNVFMEQYCSRHEYIERALTRAQRA